MNLAKSQKKAAKSAKRRGHEMGEWEALTDHSARSLCLNCSCEVIVNARPQPNEIEIGGEAIAIECD